MRNWWIFRGIKVLFFLVLGIFIFGIIIMALWNWLIPDIFNGPEITYWQGVGLLLLARILTGGIRPGIMTRHKHNWRHKMYNKWSNMTDEQRAAYKERMKNFCKGQYDLGSFKQKEEE